MEKISDGKFGSIIAPSNELYLDGSHNEDAASNLMKQLVSLRIKSCV